MNSRKEYHAQYYLHHKDKIKQSAKLYAQTHKKELAFNARVRRGNKDGKRNRDVWLENERKDWLEILSQKKENKNSEVFVFF